MKTAKLYDMAREKDITVDIFPLERCKSVCVSIENKNYVAIDPGVLNNRAQERVCLAHELGHCETASFYNIHSPLDIRQKHENRADKWAIQQLVPFSALKSALRSGYRDIPSLAEYFDVTEDFMKKVIDHYLQK